MNSLSNNEKCCQNKELKLKSKTPELSNLQKTLMFSSVKYSSFAFNILKKNLIIGNFHVSWTSSINLNCTGFSQNYDCETTPTRDADCHKLSKFREQSRQSPISVLEEERV